jgi:hypothetical protein
MVKLHASVYPWRSTRKHRGYVEKFNRKTNRIKVTRQVKLCNKVKASIL